MATNPIENYLAARARLQEATARVEGMVQTLQRIANHLRNWRRVVIGGAGGFSYPAMAAAPDLAIREHEWPQLQPLRNAMQEWHRVKLEVENAWRNIPEDRRAGLEPPPG